MALTLQHVDMEVRELAWSKFLASLKPWELHRLYNMDELFLHDQFMSGSVTLHDVRLTISFEEE